MPIRPDLEHTVTFQAAWDKRSSEPSRDYGVHGVEIRFVLRGPAGAVYAPVLTDWMLPEVAEWHEQLGRKNPSLLRARTSTMLGPISVHSLTPREGFQISEQLKCDFLAGRCYMAMLGFLYSDEVWERMLRGGDQDFWQTLEEIYERYLEAGHAHSS